MHLVDAIRMAAAKSGGTQPQPATDPAPATSAVTAPSNMETPFENQNTNPEPALSGVSDVNEPVPVSNAVAGGGGSVVRLELFLTQEQMNQMLRGILNGAHTVMTLREAAQYLRVNNETLTKMAETGEISGFMVEGRWKFPRHSVEEWITLQTLQRRATGSEEEQNAA